MTGPTGDATGITGATGAGATGPAPASATGAMRPGTLARQLVLRVTALVAATAIALSVMTAIAMHSILTDQLDQQLVSAARRFLGPNPGGGRYPGSPDGSPGIGAGQTQGLLVYVQGLGGIVQVGSDQEIVPDSLTSELDAVPATDQPVTRYLTGLGEYRLIATSTGAGVRVTGLPTAGLQASMTSILLAAGAFTIVAIAAAAAVALGVVRRSLAPLARLAAAANQVSNLPLDSGEVDVGVRVPKTDADPRSEVGQVGVAFNQMLDNVEGALAARHRSEQKVHQFVADASHELRNPLASIRGYAELTRRNRAELPAEVGHALSRIDSESARMSALVDDLLLLARLDSGPALNLTEVDLGGIVLDAVSDARAAGPDHTWVVQVPPTPVTVRADRFRIQQVVANLLSNARTHTPPGTTVTASLAVGTSTHGPGPAGRRTDAVLSVSDNGPGIPAGVQATLFERFTRADTARVRAPGSGGAGGTGLGLAIVSAVVAAHGGTVSASSPASGGATLTVRLPGVA